MYKLWILSIVSISWIDCQCARRRRGKSDKTERRFCFFSVSCGKLLRFHFLSSFLSVSRSLAEQQKLHSKLLLIDVVVAPLTFLFRNKSMTRFCELTFTQTNSTEMKNCQSNWDSTSESILSSRSSLSLSHWSNTTKKVSSIYFIATRPSTVQHTGRANYILNSMRSLSDTISSRDIIIVNNSRTNAAIFAFYSITRFFFSDRSTLDNRREQISSSENYVSFYESSPRHPHSSTTRARKRRRNHVTRSSFWMKWN